MDSNLAKEYYSRKEIQERILHFARDREIGVMYDGYFGKRPDVIETYFDVASLVKKGVQSFHCSEERWLNPLMLGSEKHEEDRNKNRIGWDLILDLDGLCFEYAQIVAKILIEYFSSLGISSLSIKFSGNKGFHLAIPFEAFSAYTGIEETRLLFPELPKKIAMFLMHTLRSKISKAIIEFEGSIETIAKKYSIDVNDLKNDDAESCFFDFMKVIEIDTILITTRHLFRMPYSLHEKSGLVSIPIDPKRIMEFSKKEAKPEHVDPEKYKEFEFLSFTPNKKDGNILISLIEQPSEEDFSIKGSYIDMNDLEEKFKSHLKKKRELQGKMVLESGEEVFEINGTVDLKDIPKTIQYVLDTSFSDGKKRALFLLLTYFTSINWTFEQLEPLLDQWNAKQEEPLKKNYISAQISWFKAQNKKISPPKFDNENYFKQIGIPKEVIETDKKAFANVTIKTPLHHTFIFLKQQEFKKNKQKQKQHKKTKEKK
jgi:DNA primase catalytic subunit